MVGCCKSELIWLTATDVSAHPVQWSSLFHFTQFKLHRSSRWLQYPATFLRTVSLRLLVVPSHSYRFAAIQCHLSSLCPSNRPVRVFPLDQKPRWLQSARVRGKASSIKTGMESDYMEYTGFKISLCCKNIGMDLPSFMCSSNKCSGIWGGKHVFNGDMVGHWENLFFFFSPQAIPPVLMSQLFLRGKWSTSLCDCVSGLVCLLPRLLAVCDFSSDHDRGVTVQSVQWQRCSPPASAVGQADWCNSGGRLWALLNYLWRVVYSPWRKWI